MTSDDAFHHVDSGEFEALAAPNPADETLRAEPPAVDTRTDLVAAPRRRMSPTRRLMVINIITLLTGLLFLFDAREPGWSLFTCMVLLLFSILSVAWVMASFAWLVDEDRPRVSAWPAIRMAMSPLLAATCAILVMVAVPARIGLWASQRAFDALLTQPLAPGIEHAVHQRAGIYNIARIARDGHGGAYLVTGEYHDHLTGEVVSVGFALNPSRDTTPFGQSAYRLTRVCGAWYTFAVSNVKE